MKTDDKKVAAIAIQQRVRAEKLEKARAAILKNIRGSSYKMRAAR